MGTFKEESIPVIHDEEASAENFKTKIQPNRRPVVLRGVNVGECIRKWTPDYMIANTENKDVRIHVTTDPRRMDFRSKNFKYETRGLHKVIKMASQSNGDCVYLRSISSQDALKNPVSFQGEFPVLSQDLDLPPYFEEDRFFSSVLRISSGGVRVWTHYDVMDNIYVQIKGRKEVVMWNPDEALNLYLDGQGKSAIIDIDDYEEIQKKYPKFLEAKRYTATLETGDLLFIPALWFHNMTALDFGVAVNVFWKNLDLKLYDNKDPYGNKDLLPAAKSVRMLDNVIKQLDKIPEDYKDFYARVLIDKLQKKCLLKD